MLTSGTRIGGFLIGDLLGKGAMGEVYRGEQLSLKRPVAIKRIATHLLDNEDMVRRFKREAQVLAKVNHPNVVGVIECEEFAGHDGDKHLLLVMELIEGGRSLKSCLGKHCDWRLATAVIRMAADGLAAAFEQHVVHRDIKPDNIMMTHKGVAKLVDFGLAKATESTALTMQAAPMGTPLYMSPEACRGEEIGHAGDLYSLGVSWFQMLTGKFPFNAANLHGLLYKHISEPLPNPIGLMNDVPEPIIKLCYQCMEKDPANRPASAVKLVEAIDALAAQGLILPRDARDLLAGGSGNHAAPVHGSTTAATMISDNKAAATAATMVQGAAAPTVNQGATVVANLSGSTAQAATTAAAQMAATQPTAVPASAAAQATVPPSPVPAKPASKTPMIAIAVIVLVALAGGGAYLASRGGGKPAPPPAQPSASVTAPKPEAPKPVLVTAPATEVKPEVGKTEGLGQPLIAQPPKPISEPPAPDTKSSEPPKTVVAAAVPVPVETPKPVEPPKPVEAPQPEPPKPAVAAQAEPPKPVEAPKPVEGPKPSPIAAFENAFSEKRWLDAKSEIDNLPANQREAAGKRLTIASSQAVQKAINDAVPMIKAGRFDDAKAVMEAAVPAFKCADDAMRTKYSTMIKEFRRLQAESAAKGQP